MAELQPSGTLRRVDGERHMLSLAENAVDEAAQNHPQPGLDEDARAGCVEALELLDEAQGLRDMAREQSLDLPRLARIGRGGRIAVDGQLRRGKGGLRQCRGEALLRRRHRGAMKGRRHRQALGAQALLAEGFDRSVDRRAAARDDRLIGRVEIGDRDIEAERVDRLRDARLVGGDGGHRPAIRRGGLGRNKAADLRQAQQIVARDRAGDAERDIFAIGMAGDEIRRDAEFGEKVIGGEIGEPERRLRDARVVELGLAPLALLRGEARERVDILRERLRQRALESPIRTFEEAIARRPRHHEVAQHIERLRALSGEQHADAAAGPFHAAIMEVEFLRRLDLALALALTQEEFELRSQVLDRGRDDRQPAHRIAGGKAESLLVEMQRIGELPEREKIGMNEPLREALRRALDLRAVGARKDEYFGAARREILDVAFAIAAVIFLEDGVEVGAAETEGADAAAPRLVRRARQPGARARVDVEWRLREIDARAGLVDAERRGQYAMLQRQRRFHQSREFGGHLGVADHRFDRADRAGTGALRRPSPRDLGHRLDLAFVADGGAGAMRLDERDARRAHAGFLHRRAGSASAWPLLFGAGPSGCGCGRRSSFRFP